RRNDPHPPRPARRRARAHHLPVRLTWAPPTNNRASGRSSTTSTPTTRPHGDSTRTRHWTTTATSSAPPPRSNRDRLLPAPTAPGDDPGRVGAQRRQHPHVLH